MRITKSLLAAAAAVPLLALLAGCAGGPAPAASDGSAASTKGSASDPVRIGVVGASDPYWATYTTAAKDAGISVQIVDFTEYNQPNPALAAGDLDLNQFQHPVYLSQYTVSSGEAIAPIGSTAIYPLGLYSTKYKTVAEIPAGSTVAIPNDPSNLARGLLVLQAAGLVKLTDGGTAFSTPADIDTAASKVTLQTVDASLTGTSLPDVAAAIINNDYVEPAGLKASDAIFQDDPADPKALQYVNIFAARAADAQNPTYVKLVQIYQDTTAVLDGVQEKSGGTAVFLKTPVAELQGLLTQAEADYRASRG